MLVFIQGCFLKCKPQKIKDSCPILATYEANITHFEPIKLKYEVIIQDDNKRLIKADYEPIKAIFDNYTLCKKRLYEAQKANMFLNKEIKDYNRWIEHKKRF